MGDYERREYVTIRGKRYELQSFHPKAFESGVWTVNLWEVGKPKVDAFSHNIMLNARSRSEAIKKAVAQAEAQGFRGFL